MNFLTKFLISFFTISILGIFGVYNLEADTSPLHKSYINDINSISIHYSSQELMGYEFTYDITVSECKNIFQNDLVQNYYYNSCVSFVTDLKSNALDNK